MSHDNQDVFKTLLLTACHGLYLLGVDIVNNVDKALGVAGAGAYLIFITLKTYQLYLDIKDRKKKSGQIPNR